MVIPRLGRKLQNDLKIQCLPLQATLRAVGVDFPLVLAGASHILPPRVATLDLEPLGANLTAAFE